MKPDKIIFATSNEGKLREVRQILSDLGLPVYSLKDCNIVSDPEENGETFEENARIKVLDILNREEAKGAIVMADDSGLVIDAFGGEPGVHSARYLGHDTSYGYKNQVILERMQDVEGEARSARYICAIAAGMPDGTVQCVQAPMEGEISRKPAGEGGFGYDPIFLVKEYGKTAAQLTPEEKNAISHRGKALEAMKALLLEKGLCEKKKR